MEYASCIFLHSSKSTELGVKSPGRQDFRAKTSEKRPAREAAQTMRLKLRIYILAEGGHHPHQTP